MKKLLTPLTLTPVAAAVPSLGLLVGRVSLGAYMIAHGLTKWGGSGPTEQFVGYTASLGFPAPTLFAWNAILAEVGLSLLLVLGLFTRPALLGLILTMGVAAFVAHGPDPWMAAPREASKEMAMLYMFGYLMLLGTGPGRFSVDRLLSRRARRTVVAEAA